jgi:predicted XRE-type DNA-binding protein
MKSGFTRKGNIASSMSRSTPKRYTSSTRSKSARARPAPATSKLRAAGSGKSKGRVNGRDGIEHVTPADGNIFADIGFPPAEAENLRARSKLMGEVLEMIRRRNLTQARAARLFGVTQPRISDLVRGKIELFSVDSLIAMLGHAGAKIEVRVRAA